MHYYYSSKLSMAFIALSFLFILFSSSASAHYPRACNRCLHRSKSTFTGHQFTSGSCGYGPLAPTFNGGLLAASQPSLYKGGAGCGACYKVRCKHAGICRYQGTTVMVTDSHGDTNRDFVFSKKAVEAMANYGKSQELLKIGEIDVEYKRVPCDVQNRNLAVRVEEASNKPYYLAIKILYLGGQTEITSVDVTTEGSWNWTSMRRSYGAVWDIAKMLSGPLRFRFVVKGWNNRNYYYYARRALPSDWKSGVVYDTGIQIKAVASEYCYPCDSSTW